MNNGAKFGRPHSAVFARYLHVHGIIVATVSLSDTFLSPGLNRPQPDILSLTLTPEDLGHPTRPRQLLEQPRAFPSCARSSMATLAENSFAYITAGNLWWSARKLHQIQKTKIKYRLRSWQNDVYTFAHQQRQGNEKKVLTEARATLLQISLIRHPKHKILKRTLVLIKQCYKTNSLFSLLFVVERKPIN